jgi:hypothetical protein
MSSIKCGNCGLVNFKTETACKRCQAGLAEGGVHPSARVSSLRAESTPEQTGGSGGVWRDRKKVVLHASAPLPERCLKCNGTEGMKRQVFSLKYYPAYNILTALLLGFTRYKVIGVEVGLCATHWAKRKQKTRRLIGMLVASIGLFILSIALDLPIGFIIAAMMLFFISCCCLATIGPPIAIAKMKDPYLWLKGADESYINTLPQWRGGQREPIY